MRQLFDAIAPWLIPLMLCIPALWVFWDMMCDSWVEIKEWWRRVRS